MLNLGCTRLLFSSQNVEATNTCYSGRVDCWSLIDLQILAPNSLCVFIFDYYFFSGSNVTSHNFSNLKKYITVSPPSLPFSDGERKIMVKPKALITTLCPGLGRKKQLLDQKTKKDHSLQ